MPRKRKRTRTKTKVKRRPRNPFRARGKEARALVSSNHNFLIDYLLTHPCVHCGLTDIVVLEFDHIDPSKKKAPVTALINKPREVLQAEIDKCRVLCCNCHRRITAEQRGWKRVKIEEDRNDGGSSIS